MPAARRVRVKALAVHRRSSVALPSPACRGWRAGPRRVRCRHRARAPVLRGCRGVARSGRGHATQVARLAGRWSATAQMLRVGQTGRVSGSRRRSAPRPGKARRHPLRRGLAPRCSARRCRERVEWVHAMLGVRGVGGGAKYTTIPSALSAMKPWPRPSERNSTRLVSSSSLTASQPPNPGEPTLRSTTTSSTAPLRK